VNFTSDREEFASLRRKVLRSADQIIRPAVKRAYARYPNGQWWTPILDAAERMFRRTFREESGHNRHPNLADEIETFRRHLQDALERTHSEKPNTERTTAWVSTAAVNAGTSFATQVDEAELGLEWVAMHDTHVRHAHAEADGQVVPVGQSFEVAGHKMRYPGDPRAPIELWINCRCVARPTELTPALGGTMAGQSNSAITLTVPSGNGYSGVLVADGSITQDRPSLAPDDESLNIGPIPMYGVLAPEGVKSGDRRRFKAGSLRWRDLPLPVSWQKVSDDGHKGSMVVGKITKIARQGDLIPFVGEWDASPEADEAMRQVIEGFARGLSVDVDDATFELTTEDGKPIDFDNVDPEERPITDFTDARICGATIVAIPAFQEAFVAVGDGLDADESSLRHALNVADLSFAAGVSDKPWSTWTAADYTDEQWRRACIAHVCNGPEKKCHKLPILEPGGMLNRNGVHAAAASLAGSRGGVDLPASVRASAKSALRGAYKRLGETPPDSLKATAEEIEEFGRGPGWLTNPEATRRIHDYWVYGPGRSKINWGVPGDFNRCRAEVGEEIGENSPAKLRFLNQICAQWHHDALGVWPGQEGGGRHHHSVQTETSCDCEAAPALTLVAAAVPQQSPIEFFTDPRFTELTPISVTSDGRVFGHIAEWGTCHLGIPGTCVTPPHSTTGYAYFHLGSVPTTAGPLPTGKLTVGGGHASTRLGFVAAMEHYDNVATAVADVRAGEDEFGIWVSGALREGVTDAQVRELLAHPLSGDWRPIGGSTELIAACCVNDPAFPVPRLQVSIDDSGQLGLVAAGCLAAHEPAPPSLATQIVDEIELRHRQASMEELRVEQNRRQMALVAAERS
jgi:hypothetical protein